LSPKSAQVGRQAGTQTGMAIKEPVRPYMCQGRKDVVMLPHALV
jgi:hypothetical protein